MKKIVALALLALLSAGAEAKPRKSPFGDCVSGQPQGLPNRLSEKIGNFEVPVDVWSDPARSSLLRAVGIVELPKSRPQKGPELSLKDWSLKWANDFVKFPIFFPNSRSSEPRGDVEIGLVKSAGESVSKERFNSFAQPSWLSVWALLSTDPERKLLQDCSKDSCKVKFAADELKTLIANTDRLKGFASILEDRFSKFESNLEIKSYEDQSASRKLNDLRFGPDKDWLPYFGGREPLSTVKSMKEDSYVFERLNPFPQRHKQSVVLFDRRCESTGNGEGDVAWCRDVAIYNNHYFDAWERWVAIERSCGKTFAIFFESMDVDQLKGNALERALIAADMRKLLSGLVEARLRRIRSL